MSLPVIGAKSFTVNMDLYASELEAQWFILTNLNPLGTGFFHRHFEQADLNSGYSFSWTKCAGLFFSFLKSFFIAMIIKSCVHVSAKAFSAWPECKQMVLWENTGRWRMISKVKQKYYPQVHSQWGTLSNLYILANPVLFFHDRKSPDWTDLRKVEGSNQLLDWAFTNIWVSGVFLRLKWPGHSKITETVLNHIQTKWNKWLSTVKSE